MGGSLLVPGTLTVGGSLHAVALLPNGNVFLAGGQSPPPGLNSGNSTANAQLYDYLSNTLTTQPPLLQPRLAFPMVVLPSGQVLISGGANYQSGGTTITILKDAELRAF